MTMNVRRSLLILMTVAGNFLIAVSLFHLISSGHLPAHFYLFLCIALLFASSSRLSILLPSSANWRPGLLILMASIFTLPASLVPLVGIPGLIVLTPRFSWRWRHYPTTFAHVAIGLYVASVVFARTLHSSLFAAQGSFASYTFAIIVALFAHLIVNRALSAVIVAEKRNTRLLHQLGLVARELHWGYYTSYLVLVFTAIISELHPWFSLFLNSSVQLGLYKMMSYYRLLQESEARYRSLKQHHPDGICSLDLRGKFVSQNPAFEQLLGYRDTVLLEKQLVDLVHLADKTTVATCDELLSGPLDKEVELLLRHQSGDYVNVSCTSVPIMVQGHRVGLYLIVKDIGPRKRTEEYMRQAEKLNTVGQLAAGVAHEIRNPLTALKGFVELLRRDIPNDKKQQYLDIMKSELTRIEYITGELLILGKPHAVNMRHVDLRTTLMDVVNLLNTLALMRNVQIRTIFPDDIRLLRCDENQLKQVFINLAKNGIESMEQGTLTIRMQSGETEITVEIEDEGTGIPSDDLGMIGSPFYTTKAHGTGLGLTISQRIITTYQGRLELQSQPGRGTKVTVTIPVQESNIEVSSNKYGCLPVRL